MLKKLGLGTRSPEAFELAMSSGIKTHWTRARWLACGLFVSSCLGSGALAADRQLKVPELSREESSLARDFNRAKIPASEPAKAALQKQAIYHISMLTQANQITNYTQHRKNLGLMLAERNQTPEARAALIAAIGRYATGVATDAGATATDGFSPAARINCTAILAELDEQSENLRERRPPLPSRDAFVTLMKMAGDTATPAHLRAIALHGIERHVRVYWGTPAWDEARQNEVQKVALAIITSTPKTKLEESAHAWLARRAYDILGAAEVPAAANLAIAQLADENALPSLRLSALSYLSQLDLTNLAAEKQSAYLIGMAHFLRSRLVHWYEFEEDVIKRDTNAQAAGMGGFGGMGGYGAMMGGGGEEESGGMGGYDGDMGGYGGYGGQGNIDGGGSATAKPKPIETQGWRTRSSRRLLNQISQTVRVALDGKPLASATAEVAKPLTTLEGNADLQSHVMDLVALVDELQLAINDAEKIKDINTLLNAAKLPIQNIMDFAVELPGFAGRYPQLADEDETLETVPDAPQLDVEEGAGEEGGDEPSATDDGESDESESGAAGQ